MAADLERFPRPGVTVDLALMTVLETDDGLELRLLVQERHDPTGRALPGRFIRERQTVAETVDGVLRDKVGIQPGAVEPRLLRVFDDPDRDDRTWAISVAHSVSLPHPVLTGAVGHLVPVTQRGRLKGQGPLLFDHDEIVAAAISGLRERYEIRQRYVDVRPDPDGFLKPPYTLHQLRLLHEAVIGDELHKDNFARRMKPFLRPVMRRGQVVKSSDTVGRPATLYRPIKG